MASMSDYLQGQLLDHVYRGVVYTPPTGIYLALFTTAPAMDGTGGIEVIGGSYARQLVTFSAAVVPGGRIDNNANVNFLNMPDCDIVSGATYDDVAAGNLLQLGDLPAPQTVVAGTNLSLAIGDFSMYFQ